MEIEKALNTRVNYNFAIDLDGHRYVELPDGNTTVQTQQAQQADTYPVQEKQQKQDEPEGTIG